MMELTTNQIIFLMQNNNAINEAVGNDDKQYIDDLEVSPEYWDLFEDIPLIDAWEAYERYFAKHPLRDFVEFRLSLVAIAQLMRKPFERIINWLLGIK